MNEKNEKNENSGRKFSVAVIPGDGIGQEVIKEAQKAVDAAASLEGASFEWVGYPFGAAHYLKTGETLPKSAIDELKQHSAILLGAVGDPAVKPGILEHGILLALRFVFDQYVNLRPSMSLPNVPTPVPLGGGKIDSVVVRENTEDLYMGLGAIAQEGELEATINLERGKYSLRGHLGLLISPHVPFAAQIALNSGGGVARITRYACETARKRGEKRVTIVSKSNAAPALYGFFEESAGKIISDEYPEITGEVVNVDALCYHLVRQPASYGVLLCPNLFGDIISDLQAGLAGGMGIAAGANIGEGLSMFEPVHGSAPDIAGTGKANPIAAILSGALMLRHLGLERSASAIENAVSGYMAASQRRERPFEFSGEASCSMVGDAVVKRI
ncbi:MAG: isocitrate/isopropylmalate dehydrogenase family protein [Synergistaceae bacterium]|jgi:3-isopropylmalate dehydrogenase|nr:isocitrate/isopropylmalate dehydrogenase family protein [Synergistaceae bacterium]